MILYLSFHREILVGEELLLVAIFCMPLTIWKRVRSGKSRQSKRSSVCETWELDFFLIANKVRKLKKRTGLSFSCFSNEPTSVLCYRMIQCIICFIFILDKESLHRKIKILLMILYILGQRKGWKRNYAAKRNPWNTSVGNVFHAHGVKKKKTHCGKSSKEVTRKLIFNFLFTVGPLRELASRARPDLGTSRSSQVESKP